MLFQPGVVILGIIQFIFQFQTCASSTQNNVEQFSNNTTWVGVVVVAPKLKDSKHDVQGSILENEGIEAETQGVGRVFEELTARAEEQRQKAKPTFILILLIGVVMFCTISCFMICSCCEKEARMETNTRVNPQPNWIPRPSPQINSDLLRIDGTTDLFINEWRENPNRAPSPHAYRIQTQSSRLDEPPSYDQCVLIPTTLPDTQHATAPPEEQDENLPPYFFQIMETRV